MSSKMGHVRSKTRLLGQILEKPCVHSRGHIFSPIRLKVKLFLFVLDHLTQIYHPTQKIILRSRGEKTFFYRSPPKRPIACQESGFYHTGSVVLWTHAFLQNL